MGRTDLEAQLREKTHWDKSDVLQLSSLARLRGWRFLPGSTFEPDSLDGLEHLKALQFIVFENSELERENLRALAGMDALRRLDLKGCRFAADDFAFLCEQWERGSCPKLGELWLEGTPIDDEDLRVLGRIERLRWLILSHTAVSDAGLAHLRGLRKLETLWLQGTHVTEEGVLGLAPLSHLSIVVPDEDTESEKLRDRLFRAQLDLQKSKKPLDPAQVEAAEAQLRAFLGEIEDWERGAYTRAQDIEARHKSARPQSNVLSEAESAENDQFWSDINAQKTLVAQKFCSAKLLGRGAGRAGSYGNPPRFTRQDEWIDVETPSKKKTIFYGEGDYSSKKRFIMVVEDDAWKLDEVQWWSGGWKRDIV